MGGFSYFKINKNFLSFLFLFYLQTSNKPTTTITIIKNEKKSRSQSISKKNHLSFSHQINLLITKKKDPSANSKDSNLITKNKYLDIKHTHFKERKMHMNSHKKLKKLNAPPTPPQERDGLSRLVSLLHGNNMDSTISVDQV